MTISDAKIVASFSDDCRGVIYYRNIFIIQATAVPMRLFHLVNCLLYHFVHPFLKVIKTAYHDIGYVTLFFTAIETRGSTIFLMTLVVLLDTSRSIIDNCIIIRDDHK